MQNIFFGANNISPVNVVVNLLFAFVLSFIIALVYKNTHKGLSYSQSYLYTLILTGMIIATVMMVIGNSLARAFGAFGAFSLIRFRTAIKDVKDMAFIFLILAVGMAVGTDNYFIAVAITAISLSAVVILTKRNFGSIRKYDYILTFYFHTQNRTSDTYKGIFDKYLKNTNLLHVDAKEGGMVLKLIFNIKFSNDQLSEAFLKELSQQSGVTQVSLINAKSDIEY